MDYKKHIGGTVIHRHRENQEGQLIDVIEGVNTLLRVLWDGQEFPSWMPPQDVIFKGV